MNIEEIKRVIVDQKEGIETIFKDEKIVGRGVPHEKLRSYLDYPNILAILGPRRSGKSILSLLLLRDKPYGYVNFDDERLIGLEARDLNKVLQGIYELFGNDLDFLIFDEIQNIPGWELFVTRLRQTKRIIISGSNAKLLSMELSTHLTGRYIDFILTPFSFCEFLMFKEVFFGKEELYSTAKIAEIKKRLEEYIELGGFPEAYKFGKPIVSKIYGDIINKDILSRYTVRHTSAFRELARYLISNFGCEMSFSKLRSVFSIKNLHTVKNYVDYLTTSYLIFLLERFSFKLKHQAIAPRKVYCIDTGIINSLAFQFSENKGRLIENLVAVELHRRKNYLGNNLEIYYWKDHSGREVDFVLKEGRDIKQLIQICYHLREISIKERELKTLIKAGQELKCKDLLVITWDEEGEERLNSAVVRSVPLWKWLLESQILI